MQEKTKTALRVGYLLALFGAIAFSPTRSAAQEETAAPKPPDKTEKTDVPADAETEGEASSTEVEADAPAEAGVSAEAPKSETAPEATAAEPSESEAETGQSVLTLENRVAELESAMEAMTEEEDDEYIEEEFESSFFSTRLYGVIDAYWEQVFNEIAGVDEDGDTIKESPPNEFDIPNLTLNVQGTLADRYSYFLTLAFPGASEIDPRSAWVNASLYGDYIAVRAGKMYRKFGIYNEILDAVPTYMGIEPPELFDGDHLLLTRTTNLMVHGAAQFGASRIRYSITTGNDERADKEVPLGFDLRYEWRNTLFLGSSFYTTNGDAVPSKGVGDGSPDGGVATWMAKDKYLVYGGYGQLNIGGFKLQTEFWQAYHDALRDPEQIILLVDAGLNDRQSKRFGLDTATPTENDVIENVKYLVTTFYVRMGFTFDLKIGALTPYLQYDFYRNPETIANKGFGGDNEAGLSDDGQFHKTTWGIVYRPIPPVALKIDGSTHIQEFNDSIEVYPEMRVSLSYMWTMPALGGEL